MKRKIRLQRSGIYLGTLVGGILLFLLVLTGVWLLPDDSIHKNIERSMELIESEDTGWAYSFTHTFGSRLDNWTDSVMIRSTYAENRDYSAFKNAVSVNGYSRYWHGYLVFLRPLLCVFSYAEIRYIYMFVLIGLLGVNLIWIRDQLSKINAYLFLFTMCLGYVIILPFSLQYSSVFYILLITNMILLKFSKLWKSKFDIAVLFLVVGMVTNYVDFFTAPLLTLGIPMALVILLRSKKLSASGWENIEALLAGSVSWGIGYAVTWISKWVIASVVLHVNVLEDALLQADLRVNGTGDVILDRSQIIYNNVVALLPPGITEMNHFFAMNCGMILALIVIFWVFRKKTKEILSYVALLLLAVFPYIWYLILADHSQVHYIFTYRTQLITVFALLTFYFNSITLKKTGNG